MVYIFLLGMNFVLVNKILTIINIVLSAFVIILGKRYFRRVTKLGISKYAFGKITQFSTVFVPFYLIVFGSALIAAEMGWQTMIK